MKKGQVAVFIVIGILILAVLGLLSLQVPIFEKAPKSSLPVKQLVEACFVQTAYNSVSWFYSMDSERNFLPLVDGETSIWWPIWYDAGKILLPEDVKPLIAQFGVAAQGRCTDGFKAFQNVKEISRDVLVEYLPSGVLVTLNQPVYIGEDQAKVDITYKQIVGLRLKEMLDVAHGLLNKIKENPNYIPINYIVDEEIKNKMDITYAYLDDGTKKAFRSYVVYQIKDLTADPKVTMPYIKFIARME